jgi:hypothetical protein
MGSPDAYKVAAQWQLYCLVHNIEKTATKAMRAEGQRRAGIARIDAQCGFGVQCTRPTVRPADHENTPFTRGPLAVLSLKNGLMPSLIGRHKSRSVHHVRRINNRNSLQPMPSSRASQGTGRTSVRSTRKWGDLQVCFRRVHPLQYVTSRSVGVGGFLRRQRMDLP